MPVRTVSESLQFGHGLGAVENAADGRTLIITSGADLQFGHGLGAVENSSGFRKGCSS